MRFPRLVLSFTLISAASLALVMAQQSTPPAPAAGAIPQPPRGRTSPHETVSTRIENNRVTIIYGRPYSRHPRTGEMRKVWGSLVPYGQVWRTGADEATLLVTQQALNFNGTIVPAGAYSLYTLPAADGTAQLLVSRKIGQWGAEPYEEEHELARIPMSKETLPENIDQFTMAIDRNPAGGGFLRMKWEYTQFTAPFTVEK
jgi:hypothetical protein